MGLTRWPRSPEPALVGVGATPPCLGSPLLGGEAALTDARVGFVARLRTGPGKRCAQDFGRRSRAAARLRRWERCSEAVTVGYFRSGVPQAHAGTLTLLLIQGGHGARVQAEGCTRESAVLTPGRRDDA